MKFLVTAGSTHEAIDEVRAWGNIFTGNTGYAIAKALARHGAVDLVTSNAVHLAEAAAQAGGAAGVRGVGFTSHADLKQVLTGLVPGSDYRAIFMTAAVADYRPQRMYEVVERQEGPGPGAERWVVRDVQAGKVSGSYRQIAILGERTEKIVDLFRSAWGHRGLLFKFKLEVGLTVAQLLAVGRTSRQASGADFLIANTLDMVAGAHAGAWLIGADGEEWVARAELAERLAELAVHTKPGA